MYAEWKTEFSMLGTAKFFHITKRIKINTALTNHFNSTMGRISVWNSEQENVGAMLDFIN